MELPVLNVELLSDVVTWAALDARRELGDAGPDSLDDDLVELFRSWGSWDQQVWASERRNGTCQSAYCIAGQVVNQVGMGMVLEHTGYDEETGRSVYHANVCAPRTFVGLDDKGVAMYDLDREQTEWISTVGRQALGLNADEAEALFDGDNDIHTVVSLALLFARARGVDLELDDWVVNLATLTDSDLARELEYAGDTYLETAGIRR